MNEDDIGRQFPEGSSSGRLGALVFGAAFCAALALLLWGPF